MTGRAGRQATSSSMAPTASTDSGGGRANVLWTSPGYGFASHKGYSTPEHLAALKALGASPHHRVSFAPVAECLGLPVREKSRATRDPNTPDLFA